MLWILEAVLGVLLFVVYLRQRRTLDVLQEDVDRIEKWQRAWRVSQHRLWGSDALDVVPTGNDGAALPLPVEEEFDDVADRPSAMSITQNASRVRVESAAKNGTLGTQGTLNADQIKFDTNISTNNSNLEASPTFQRRHVVIRRGDADEESNHILSVDVDGVTCTCQHDWVAAPASGDTYDIAYRLEDAATIAGLDFESDSQQWTLSTKRLTIGDGTNFAFFGMSHGQVLRLADQGDITSDMRVSGTGRFHIGTIKDDIPNLGATLIFLSDVDNDLAMDWLTGAAGRLYEFTLIAARNHTGVNTIDVTVQAGCDIEWMRSQIYGVDAPFKIRAERIADVTGAFYSTVGDIKNAPWYSGWLKSETDQTIIDEIAAEPNDTKVRIMLEFS